ncbi:8701_t:CDS:2 [Funneliformis mosseae]|uniref:8701_t:CDS:1 n=1 Tax=Funneliformis mosseae TaxID=27381 RepID=A0A9N9F1S3_FUNMO|nr:8701_t:CDS:2 [Funneliformis mosseae]
MSKKLFFPQLSHDLTKLITDERFSDVIIETGRDDDKNSFKAHSSILYCRSPYLRKELLRNEKSDDLLRIDLNIPVKTFRALLRIQPFQQIFDPKVYDSVMMRYCMIPSIQGELTTNRKGGGWIDGY